MRRIRRVDPPPLTAPEPVRCLLCSRPVPPGQLDWHHLVPKLKGGRETAPMHRICHRQVHALFSETELARHYATAPALLAHPEVRAFVDWVSSKPNDFYETVRRPRRRQ
ncbi:MAG: HNH endonuclease [Betaproteobacteria bacterium]|nr:HNH endonuclease [Betaproteobacteria bacterium]